MEDGYQAGHRDRPRPANAPDGYFNDPDHTQLDQADGCHFHLRDEPRVEKPDGDLVTTFSVTFVLTGQIWDTCWARLEEERRFAYTIAGKIAFGQASVEAKAHLSDGGGKEVDIFGEPPSPRPSLPGEEPELLPYSGNAAAVNPAAWAAAAELGA